MLLDRIVLHNFGVYRGNQELVLTPPSASKPVILIGALNGAGKTTLLDALQLVLYGKLAQCSNRRDFSYEEYLRRSIHRSVDPRDGASLTLEFRHRTDGEEHRYCVQRQWAATERTNTVRERLEVFVDDKLDSALTETWADFVEGVIPVRLSKFFFFDGEQIEALADLERSAEVLATAIQSLLGLDLVDQLGTDLKVIERRHREKQRPEREQAALLAARTEVEQLELRAEDARSRSAAQRNQVDRLRKLFRGLEEEFRRAGGDAYAKRQQVESERDRVASRHGETETKLLDLASGAAPLLLVRDRLEELSTSTQSGHSAENAANLVKILALRDKQTIGVAQKAGAADKVLRALREHLQKDVLSRKTSPTKHPVLTLTAELRRELSALCSRGLAESEVVARVLLDEAERLQTELQNLDRVLASTPSDEAVAALTAQLNDTRQELARAEGAHKALEEEQRRNEAERERKWNAYSKQSEAEIDERFYQLESTRIIEHSETVRNVLVRFKVAAAERHVRRIEQLILDGLHHLLRKDGVISKLSIDPVTYRISLLGRDGQPLSTERLSAGERQLLAIAMIWGLARAAGRPLPVVIDTPLGRLDSVHRRHLVERYFSAASHQVLLLSTDEEIDDVLYSKMSSYIGRRYLLNYDDENDATRVVSDDYFFEAA